MKPKRHTPRDADPDPMFLPAWLQEAAALLRARNTNFHTCVRLWVPTLYTSVLLLLFCLGLIFLCSVRMSVQHLHAWHLQRLEEDVWSPLFPLLCAACVMGAHGLRYAEERGSFCRLSCHLSGDSRARTQVSGLVFWQVHSTLEATALAQLSDSLRHKQELGCRFPPAIPALGRLRHESEASLDHTVMSSSQSGLQSETLTQQNKINNKEHGQVTLGFFWPYRIVASPERQGPH